MFDTKNLKEMISSFYKCLIQTHKELTNVKLTDYKWSLREIIGHLIDSASNNHQRFVRLQFGDLLDFPAYDAEDWIRIQKYNFMDWDVLIALWYNYNCLLINIIENADEAVYQNVWVRNQETLSFEKLIYEYCEHLELHIDQFNNRKEEI